ncbi:MAG TPA: type II toxin-antitoxin system VapC family toxin [Candidatus Eisenbacteria bacterium]
MTYWDTSALVALYVGQVRSAEVRALAARPGRIVTWTVSEIEVRSALARLEREASVPADALRQAREDASRHWESFAVIGTVDAVKTRARRLLGVHALRAADALQLAAALTAASDDPTGHSLVTLDERLATAAGREGFTILP